MVYITLETVCKKEGTKEMFYLTMLSTLVSLLRACRTVTSGSSPESLFLELQHLVDEALPLLPDDVTLRNTDIVKENLYRVGTPHSHLVDLR